MQFNSVKLLNEIQQVSGHSPKGPFPFFVPCDLSLCISFSSRPSFLACTPQHCHELASPWLTGCAPLPGGVPLNRQLPLLQGNLSSSPGHNNHIYSWNSLISTFSPNATLRATFPVAGSIFCLVLPTFCQTYTKVLMFPPNLFLL